MSFNGTPCTTNRLLAVFYCAGVDMARNAGKLHGNTKRNEEMVMNNDWIAHNGQRMPSCVSPIDMVEVKLQNGSRTGPEPAAHFRWSVLDSGHDIIAYRLHKPEPDATPLTKQLAHAVAKRDKHQSKLDKWSAEVERLTSELERDIEEQTTLPCSIGGVKLGCGNTITISGGNVSVEALCNAMKSSAAGGGDIPEDVDVDDPKTWKEWDVVECIDNGMCRVFSAGREYLFNGFDSRGDCGVVSNDEGNECWPAKCLGVRFRFVRRPS